MTKDDLYTQLRYMLSDKQVPWPTSPLCPGDWKAFDQEESVRILARLVAEQTARAENPIPFHSQVRQLRGTPLKLYPDHLLIEGLADLNETGATASFVFIFAQKKLDIFTWSSSDVLRLNRRTNLKLATQSDYIDYVHFYCGISTGNGGRFKIIEQTEQLKWQAGAEKQQIEVAGSAIEKATIRPHKESGQLFVSSAVYDNTLYKATFEISPRGAVDVIGREIVQENLPLKRERFHGPFLLMG